MKIYTMMWWWGEGVFHEKLYEIKMLINFHKKIGIINDIASL